MTAIRRSPRTLTLTVLLAALALATAAMLLVPLASDAEPAHGTHIRYYDTPACDNQVGFRYYDCEGQLQSGWGIETPYSISNTYGCEVF